MERTRYVKLGRLSCRNALAIALLIALWGAFLWKAFDPARSFSLLMDNEFFIGTVLASMSNSLRHGEWPLRMVATLGGVPLYNLTQFSSFYPFYFTLLPLFSTPLDAASAMHWVTLLHILVFEINLFILLRVLGVSRLAAVVGAGLIAFGANSLAYVHWMNIVAPYSWLPLYLAGLVGVVESRPSIRYPAMALVGLVLLAWASPSQPLIHAVLMTAIIVLVYGWRVIRSPQGVRGLLSPLHKVAVIATLAVLLAAPAVLPALLEFKDMIRWIGPYPPITGFDHIPFEAFLIDQLSLPDFAGVLVKIKSQSVGSQYVGPVVVALAVLAVWSSWRSWVVLAMAVVAVYSLASSAGSNLGLAYINYVVPLVNKIREPSRALFLFQMSMGILAAFGMDALRQLLSHREPQQKWRGMALFLAGLALLSLFIGWMTYSGGKKIVPTAIAAGLLLLLLVITTLARRHGSRRLGATTIWLWGVSALVVLAVNVRWIPLPLTDSTYLQNDGVRLDIAIRHVEQLDPGHEYRVIFEGSIDKQMAAMLASYRNIRTLNSYFNPAPLQQFNELYYHGPRSDNYPQILGAKYLICRDCSGSKFTGYRFRESIHGYDIHEAPDALPYVQVRQHVDGSFSSLNEFTQKAAVFDLSKGLLFTDATGSALLNNGPTGRDDCVARADVRKSNQIRLQAACRSPGVLVVNEFYTSQWRATVNGVKVAPVKVNGNQIGIPLAPGSQIVELNYAPRTFRWSLYLAALGLGLLVMGLLWRKMKGRN